MGTLNTPSKDSPGISRIDCAAPTDTIGMAGCKTTMRMADKVDITNDDLGIHASLVEICLIEMTHSGILGEV